MSPRDVVIVPYQDGPYLVRGPVVLLDQDGHGIELNRRTIALCRCGKSQMRPFCDGTHRMIGFRVPSAQERPRTGNSKLAKETLGANALRTSPRDGQADGRSRAGALRTAESLLMAARLQLERNAERANQREGLESTSAEPALCLVAGALEALCPFVGNGAPEISRVVKELTALSKVLRTTSERT